MARKGWCSSFKDNCHEERKWHVGLIVEKLPFPQRDVYFLFARLKCFGRLSASPDYAFVRQNVRVTIKLRIHLRENRSISERRKAGYVSGEEMTINQKRYRDTAPFNQHRIHCNDFRVLLSSALW